MLRHYETSLALYVGTHECTHDVTVVYSVDPACGDGWNEPRTPASASVDRVEVRADNGATVDVYPLLIVAEEAWGQLALKGLDAVKPIYLPAKQVNHANPLGRFGYVGAQFMKAAVRLNEQWMVRYECAATYLS